MWSLWVGVFSLASASFAADLKRREFDVPADIAGRSLKVFARQSGMEILISTELGLRTRTQAVKGSFTAREALDHMLVGSGLAVDQDRKTGALAILPETNAGLNAALQTAGPVKKKAPGAARSRSTGSSQRSGMPGGVASTGVGKPADDLPVTIELSPFVVNAGEDRGYQAQSSLAGGRLKTDLNDIAAPVSSFTEQFLFDTAVTNTDDLARFMLSTEYDFSEEAGNQNPLLALARPLRVRGLDGGQVTTNFFRTGGRSDVFSLERIDQSRGPNAILFGIGNPGGIITTTTKRARLDRNQGVVSGQIRNYHGTRVEGDYNQVLIPDRLAVRIAGVTNRLGSWRNHEFNDDDRFFGTFKWKITPRTELNAEFERGRIEKRSNRTFTALDGYTVWAAAGRLLSMVPDPLVGVERTTGAAGTWLVFNAADQTLMNYAASTRSGARPVVGGDPTMLDFSVLPRETSLLGAGMGQADEYNRLSFFLTHAVTPDLNFELAVMRLDDHFNNVDAQQAISQYLRADTSPLLPNGTINPQAGRTYLETQTQRNFRDNRMDAVRFTGSYAFDLKRLGTHTLAAVMEYNYEKAAAVQLREFVLSPNAPSLLTPENNNNRIWRRNYVDLSGFSEDIVLADWREADSSGFTDPVSGRTYATGWIPFSTGTQLTATESRTYIGMLQSRFLENRLNTVVGLSRDERTSFNSTLTRQPLAGFVNGTLTPVRDRDGTGSSAQNVTFSGVLHVTPWLGLTYSKAQNQGLLNLSGSIPSPDGSTPNVHPPRVVGRSEDLGFKLNLFDRRLFLSAIYFQTTAANAFDSSPPVTQSSINLIWDALAANGINDPLTLAPIISPRDVVSGMTFSSRTAGYEVELTANPTRNWRVFLNFSRSKTVRTDIAPELVNYIAKQRGYWTAGDRGRLYLVGRGVGLASQERDGNTTVDTIAEEMDVIDNSLLTNVTFADGRRPLGQIPQQLNFRTAYDFDSGPLKGFGAGLGFRWQDRPVVRFVPATPTSASNVGFGSPQFFADCSLSYTRRFSVFGRHGQWSIQLNVDNALNNDKFVVLRENVTGEIVNYRFNDPRMWILTNRFSF